MDPQGPPLHYPRPSLSSETDRTIAGSAPPSPREEIPNHVFEGEPPLYGDTTTTAEDEIARRKERRTTCIKFATSIFIAVIVCLVAAAVIGKIHENQARKYAASAAASKTHESSSTASTTTTPVRLTMAGEHIVKTPTSTSTLLTSITPQPVGSSFSIECPCRNRVFLTVEATSTAATTSTCTSGCEATKPPKTNVMGYAMCSFHGCILTRTAYRGAAGDLSYECSVMCGRNFDGQDVADEVGDDCLEDC